jgi:hypothetical protein
MRNVLIAVLITLTVLGVPLGISLAIILSAPVQAAQPAPPTVAPCDLVNTATLGGGGVIEIFKCVPDGGTPYLLDSYGFMKDVEQ